MHKTMLCSRDYESTSMSALKRSTKCLCSIVAKSMRKLTRWRWKATRKRLVKNGGMSNSHTYNQESAFQHKYTNKEGTKESETS